MVKKNHQEQFKKTKIEKARPNTGLFCIDL
jgi:hypothetical protein